jgi:TolA-binding protein
MNEKIEKAEKSEKSDKKRTAKSVLNELERVRKSSQKRGEKIAELKKEISLDNSKIKELEKMYESLQHEELQAKIASEWLKEKKLTDEQVAALLEIGKQIGDKIDSVGAEVVVDAVNSAYVSLANRKPPEPPPVPISEREKISENNNAGGN